ncbi:MAG: hypothetical protein PHE25_03865, partial [Candidatus Gracilibacteria bacterium]|nr:hypothetical protein [Candidatus Gracilibacteria bacterium]
MNKKVFEFVSKQTKEQILGWKTCSWCDSSYPVFQKEQNYLTQNNLPVSDLCLECRFRNLLAFRNERNLYWRNSDKSGEKILSIYSQELDKKIWSYLEWDKEEGFDKIFKNYDENIDFIDSYFDLLKE